MVEVWFAHPLLVYERSRRFPRSEVNLSNSSRYTEWAREDEHQYHHPDPQNQNQVLEYLLFAGWQIKCEDQFKNEGEKNKKLKWTPKLTSTL